MRGNRVTNAQLDDFLRHNHFAYILNGDLKEVFDQDQVRQGVDWLFSIAAEIQEFYPRVVLFCTPQMQMFKFEALL